MEVKVFAHERGENFYLKINSWPVEEEAEEFDVLKETGSGLVFSV